MKTLDGNGDSVNMCDECIQKLSGIHKFSIWKYESKQSLINRSNLQMSPNKMIPEPEKHPFFLQNFPFTAHQHSLVMQIDKLHIIKSEKIFVYIISFIWIEFWIWSVETLLHRPSQLRPTE